MNPIVPTDNELLDARILVVDDRLTNVQLLEQLLASAGYRQVTSCQDPRAVCELHRQQHFDLILLDLQMPGMDGFEVMAQLGEMERHGYIPVLAITAQPGHKLRALEAGAKDFIVKPFELAELISRIHNLLKVRLLYKQVSKAASALESIALHDALTGLPNRRLLLDRLQQCQLNSTRTQHYAALMFMDLDQFKLLNDTLGHDLGDVLLKQVGARLQSCLREGDTVARFGGDEFVVLLDKLGLQPEVAAAHATEVAKTILLALDQPYNLNGHAYDNTVSLGVVTFQGEGEAASRLLKMADMAMYRAKSQGRNQVCYFDPAMQAEDVAQDTLVKAMRHGLSAHEFVLYFQLQVDAQGVPLGAQALLHWNHPQHGALRPEQLQALAEDSGMILPLAKWMLEAACLQLRVWAQSPQTAHWTLTLNVPAGQLAQADFVAQVVEVVQTTGACAQRLRLSLTEAALQSDVDDAIAKVNALLAIGVAFCLDDFGAGFAALAYLKRLPLVQLKLDQTMVRAVCTEASVAVIARAVVALGASLGLPVLVGGVDSAEQRDFFAELGCNAFQGDFFATAVLPGELPKH